MAFRLLGGELTFFVRIVLNLCHLFIVSFRIDRLEFLHGRAGNR
jgi:hypothetical protein